MQNKVTPSHCFARQQRPAAWCVRSRNLPPFLPQPCIVSHFGKAKNRLVGSKFQFGAGPRVLTSFIFPGQISIYPSIRWTPVNWPAAATTQGAAAAAVGPWGRGVICPPPPTSYISGRDGSPKRTRRDGGFRNNVHHALTTKKYLPVFTQRGTTAAAESIPSLPCIPRRASSVLLLLLLQKGAIIHFHLSR